MKNDDLRNERLVALSAMKDYKIAKDNPDVLGWRVVGADGESLGLVRDLIVDPQAMKARYLSVLADRKFFKADRDQYMLVPIGAAALDRSGKKVFLSSVDSANVGGYPVYDGGPIPEDYEYAVRENYHRSQRDIIPDTTERSNTEFDEALHRDKGSRHITGDFYNDETFNEDRFYTSNKEVYRDRNYPTYDQDKTDNVADLQSEDARPKSVEESIATIERLEHLRERGSITEEEFLTLKKRALHL
ncbi:PRC-barrel domain-containing protein [Pontibacter sp. H259]|uniref:PRC-barrel domain-containing protein n=1 Tax=Pontibacter sp. H259 TaxID=3133421 RepID=UPI0030C115A8